MVALHSPIGYMLQHNAEWTMHCTLLVGLLSLFPLNLCWPKGVRFEMWDRFPSWFRSMAHLVQARCYQVTITVGLNGQRRAAQTSMTSALLFVVHSLCMIGHAWPFGGGMKAA